jgi:hypothetical protein
VSTLLNLFSVLLMLIAILAVRGKTLLSLMTKGGAA